MKEGWRKFDRSFQVYHCCRKCGFEPIEGMVEYRRIHGFEDATCVLRKSNLRDLEMRDSTIDAPNRGGPEQDRLSRLAAYAKAELQPELDALMRLRDAAEGFPRVASAGKVPGKYVFYGRANGYGETMDAEITQAGLARLQEIRALLGEEGGETK